MYDTHSSTTRGSYIRVTCRWNQYCSYIVWSKAEIFIHVAIQNLVIIHRAQDNDWATNNFQSIVLYV